MSNAIPGIAACSTCGASRIGVNDQIICLRCESKKTPPSKFVVTTDDPGEDKLLQVLSAAGVHAPRSEKPAPAADNQKAAVQKSVAPIVVANASFDDVIKSVIVSMKSLPMPDDVKQFKKVKKILSDLESLIQGE